MYPLLSGRRIADCPHHNREGELKVVAWCQQAANPFKCVRSVKLSHHGSHFSTPYEMIRAFRPRNVIIQADTSNHGHPRKAFIPLYGANAADWTLQAGRSSFFSISGSASHATLDSQSTWTTTSSQATSSGPPLTRITSRTTSQKRSSRGTSATSTAHLTRSPGAIPMRTRSSRT